MGPTINPMNFGMKKKHECRRSGDGKRRVWLVPIHKTYKGIKRG